jgi:hypothetical protein
MTRRLIETWLPIAALGIESLRERTVDDAISRTQPSHVWWARRPLVASRAAVLASLLPEDADHGKFLHMLGIHGDPAASRRRIDAARRKGERFEGEAYSYSSAFTYVPNEADRHLGSNRDTVGWVSTRLQSLIQPREEGRFLSSQPVLGLTLSATTSIRSQP